ncbi:hypothetical protein OAB20_06355 [Winogradskyella sp.]|nr:hypothetical protein [Winogradskyella sp.]
MKQLLLFVLLFIAKSTFGQMIGDTKSSVIQLQQGTPCESGNDFLIYCLSGKDRVLYNFNRSGYLYQITRLSFASNYRSVQNFLSTKLKEFKSKYNAEPLIDGNKYIYFYDDSHSIVFSIVSNEIGYYFSEVEFNINLSTE